MDEVVLRLRVYLDLERGLRGVSDAGREVSVRGPAVPFVQVAASSGGVSLPLPQEDIAIRDRLIRDLGRHPALRLRMPSALVGGVAMKGRGDLSIHRWVLERTLLQARKMRSAADVAWAKRLLAGIDRQRARRAA